MQPFRALPLIHCLLALLLSLCAVTSARANAFDAVDLSGYWEPLLMEDFQSSYAGPDPVDFAGLPITAGARARALSYSDKLLEMPERQCMYYGTSYLVVGPFGFRLSAEADALSGNTAAWRIAPWIDRPEIKIWMDGRAHPGPEALHTVAGFTTGAWQGRTLTTQTTHLRESPLRRNGVPQSDQATITMHFSRQGDYLEITAVITDPVYLTEPLMLSRLYRQNPAAYLKNDMVAPCDPREQAADARGKVSSFLPGANPLLTKFASKYGLPQEAALGGAPTMYPEYRHALETAYKRPGGTCGSDGFCCGWGDARNPEHYNLFSALNCPGRRRTSPEVFEFIKDPNVR